MGVRQYKKSNYNSALVQLYLKQKKKPNLVSRGVREKITFEVQFLKTFVTWSPIQRIFLAQSPPLVCYPMDSLSEQEGLWDEFIFLFSSGCI